MHQQLLLLLQLQQSLQHPPIPPFAAGGGIAFQRNLPGPGMALSHTDPDASVLPPPSSMLQQFHDLVRSQSSPAAHGREGAASQQLLHHHFEPLASPGIFNPPSGYSLMQGPQSLNLQMQQQQQQMNHARQQFNFDQHHPALPSEHNVDGSHLHPGSGLPDPTAAPPPRTFLAYNDEPAIGVPVSSSTWEGTASALYAQPHPNRGDAIQPPISRPLPPYPSVHQTRPLELNGLLEQNRPAHNVEDEDEIYQAGLLEYYQRLASLHRQRSHHDNSQHIQAAYSPSLGGGLYGIQLSRRELSESDQRHLSLPFASQPNDAHVAAWVSANAPPAAYPILPQPMPPPPSLQVGRAAARPMDQLSSLQDRSTPHHHVAMVAAEAADRAAALMAAGAADSVAPIDRSQAATAAMGDGRLGGRERRAQTAVAEFRSNNLMSTT